MLFYLQFEAGLRQAGQSQAQTPCNKQVGISMAHAYSDPTIPLCKHVELPCIVAGLECGHLQEIRLGWVRLGRPFAGHGVQATNLVLDSRHPG